MWTTPDDLVMRKLADQDADGRIDLHEWLRYGEQRVPQLAGVLLGEPARRLDLRLPALRPVVRDEQGWKPAGARSTLLRPEGEPAAPVVQQPRLYSFDRTGSRILWAEQ